MSITGTILHDLATTWVGKETYLSASYCETLERMLETDEYANLYSGVSCSVRSRLK